MTPRPPSGMDASVPAVVLKMVRDHYSYGRLGAVRTLGRLGVPVYALQESRRAPVALSRFGHHVPWSISETPRPEAVEELCRLGERIGGHPLLFYSDDVETLFVDEHADELRKVFRFPDQPRGLPLRLADKGELFRLCQELDIAAPQTVFPKSRRDVESYIARERTFPVVLKSMNPHLLKQRPQAQSVAVARTERELFELYDSMEVPEEPNLMLQEYIPGGPESVWMFNGYFNADSDCLVAFTGRKIRQHPPRTGVTTLGVCESNASVEDTTRRLMKAIGYRGIVDMGYRFDARDGQYKLLDVNPRLGATFRLFVGGDGMDVVRAMYLDLTGQPVPPTATSDGRKWWVEPFDVWTARALVREHSLTWGQWLRSLRGVREAAWFAADDPMPFLAMIALFVADPINRRLNRSRIGPATQRVVRRILGTQ